MIGSEIAKLLVLLFTRRRSVANGNENEEKLKLKQTWNPLTTEIYEKEERDIPPRGKNNRAGIWVSGAVQSRCANVSRVDRKVSKIVSREKVCPIRDHRYYPSSSVRSVRNKFRHSDKTTLDKTRGESKNIPLKITVPRPFGPRISTNKRNIVQTIREEFRATMFFSRRVHTMLVL